MSVKSEYKIKLMRQALTEFRELDGEPDKFFTTKENFYFILKGNKKYLHKESLRLIYNNYNTFSDDLDPLVIKNNIIPFEFSKLKLEENKYFYVVDYIKGDLITSILREDYFNLKEEWSNKKYTPFYNQMLYNLVKGDKIYVIDYKHFEDKMNLPFFIYFYNEDQNINKLYYSERLEDIINHLTDYDLTNTELIKYEK